MLSLCGYYYINAVGDDCRPHPTFVYYWELSIYVCVQLNRPGMKYVSE